MGDSESARCVGQAPWRSTVFFALCGPPENCANVNHARVFDWKQRIRAALG